MNGTIPQEELFSLLCRQSFALTKGKKEGSEGSGLSSKQREKAFRRLSRNAFL